MNNDIENKEWVNDYPALKAVAKSNPFTVPDGFFNANEGEILSSVKILAAAPAAHQAFKVPDNYFEDLQNNTLSRIAVEEAVGLKSAFTIPKDYFENQQSNILSRVAIEDATGQKNVFATPENYFEDMHAQITNRIAVQEAAVHPFTVPDNYFNQLNAKILNQTVTTDIVQRKGVIRKLVSTAAFKYASAACFALVVGVVIILSQQNSPQALHDKTYLHKALSEVPNADIKGYLEMRVDANDANVKLDDNNKSDLSGVSADDMKDYLSNN